MKVVLLLDSSLTSSEKFKDDSNEAIIVALRLLSYLWNRDRDNVTVRPSPSPSPKRKRTSSFTQTSSRSLRSDDDVCKRSDFKWGFKFFSSTGSIVRAKPSKKTSSFTKTWNQDSFRSLQSRVDDVFKSEKETTNKRNSLTHPSERLATALTEILHDFEWQDKNDLSKSPARSRRIRKRNRVSVDEEESHKDKKNIVFIFSRAPSSRQCLRRFSNKVVIDSDVFIDSFMSPALLEEYKDKSQINVYWIDFNSLQDATIGQDTRHESLNIITESLKKLGGNLLNKQDILKCFPSNASVQYFTELTAPIISLPSEVSLLQGLLLSKVLDVHSKDITDGSIYVQGSSPKLELKGAKLTAFMSSNNNASGESSCETSTSVSKTNMSDEIARLHLSDVCIELQGCMSSIAAAEVVSSLEMQQSIVLTCDNDSKMSVLLQTLIRTQNLAILKLSPDHDKIHCQMAILTALTSTCGYIFLISLNQQISLEKGFFFDRTSVKDSCPPTVAKITKPFNSHVLNSWHKPGSTKQLNCLISDLKQRPNSQSASNIGNELMAKLKALYLINRQKQQQQQEQSAPMTSTPISGRDSSLLGKVGGSADSESGSSSSQAQVRRLSRRSSSSLSRGRLLVERARSASILMAGEEECSNVSTSRVTSPAGRRTSGSVGFESLNIQSEDELLDYLNKQYIQVLSAGVAMEASIQAMLTVTCYFMSTKEMATNPQKSAIAFIRTHLAQDPTKLKEKYGKTDYEDKKSQAVEYKLQVMLLLEMASFVPDNEEFQGERLLNTLVSMLRGLSFMIGPASVREFMANASDSYCSTLPRVLMDVYDELDLPYPAALAKLSSPSAPSTVWGANMSVGSLDSFHSGPNSSQPPSSGQRLSQGTRRTLKQHPSLTDFRQKKQILVEKPKSKPVVSKTEGKKSAKDKNKEKVKCTKPKSGGVDFGRAKRNLFTDKSKVKKAKDRIQLTPKRKSGKPKLLVPGTPAHKQTSERILSRQKRLRDHLNIKPDVQVVEESPIKDDDPHGRVENKPARFILRESFYSSNSHSQSRIVAKSMEMEEKGRRPAASPHRFLHQSRSHGSLISAVRGESPILSPRSRMIKSFMASPASEAKSNRKKATTPTPTASTSSSTPHSHLPRRSPRKSVKKLLFHSCATSTRQEPAKEQGRNMLDARLVFDGENASDALPTPSPMKNSRIPNVYELKTPEKRNQQPGFGMWETTSCPPFQVTPTKFSPRKVKTPELSFRNVFNTPSTSNNKSPELKFIRNSPRKSLQDIHSSPSKLDNSHEAYQKSSGKKVGLKKSKSDSMGFHNMNRDFVNLQKRISPQKATRKGQGSTKRMSCNSFKISDVKNNPSRCASTSNSNRFEIVDVDDDDLVLSTPKKSRYDSNHSSFHTTPSKVTFSDSFLISPPTGSGRPVPLTPTRSILKGSPSVKNQSFMRRIELADLESQRLPDASFLSPISKKSSVVDSPFKISSLSIRELSSKSLAQDKKSHRHLSSKSAMKQIDKRIPSNTKRFDEDSSSSCESSSFNTNTIQAPPSTVVTAHTASPSNTSKTPDSINKWMRKKRNSGNRTVSSSSSSSVSPTSSGEVKEKVSGLEMSTTSVDDESCVIDGKNLKRNLFSIDTASSSGVKSPRKKGKDTSDIVGKAKSTKPIVENEILDKASKGKGKGKGKHTKLFSHTSGGFSHNNEGRLQLCDDSNFKVQKRLTMEEASTASSSETAQTASYSCFSPAYSPSKKIRVLHQSSSFMGEGSQGFLFNSENPNNSDNSSPTVKMPSASKLDNVVDADTDTLSVDVSNKCPGGSKSTPPKKQQYSPALSTSGLLQLIASPLLDDAKKDKTKKKRETRSSKSRKHLDWPL